MDNPEVVNRITGICNELAKLRFRLNKFVLDKPVGNAIIRFQKKMELELAVLRDKNTPVTVRKATAQAKCKQQEADLENAKIEYRAICTMIDAAAKELNGWQSVFRHQTEVYNG
jgi:hypothetical protein